MKLSSLAKALGIFAVATQNIIPEVKAQNDWMNPITICNNFPTDSSVNLTLGLMQKPVKILSGECLNISAADTDLFQPQGDGNAVLGINIQPDTGYFIGAIEASEFGDMILEGQSGPGESYNCIYRTSKNQIDVTPLIDYQCPSNAPSFKR